MTLLLILINSILVFALLLFSALTYRNLPKRIPIHFGISGTADGYGNKLFYWLMPILGLIFFATFSTQIADLKSLKIADIYSLIQNWNLDLQTSFGMLINTFVLILFLEIQSSIYKVALGQKTKMSKSIWIWTILIVIVSVIIATLKGS
ncbi:DUF1648 domain-containing protein [Soonwooa sp.]|uniref:DUF1648 domain-containing protein n=1 Tax=Soonwooa sp. TaxID=1938592 RepID=UPI0026096204|nr:DUF1648 domain-containing protein [Soonwooa sp.]